MKAVRKNKLADYSIVSAIVAWVIGVAGICVFFYFFTRSVSSSTQYAMLFSAFAFIVFLVGNIVALVTGLKSRDSEGGKPPVAVGAGCLGVIISASMILFCAYLVYLYSLSHGYSRANPRRLPEDSGISMISPPDQLGLYEPVWSPDGSKLAVSAGRGNAHRPPRGQIYTLDVSSGELSLIEEADLGNRVAQSWSPDGSEIAFYADGRDVVRGIWVVNADGSGEPRFLGEGKEAAWSPDGQWVAILETHFQRSHLGSESIRILDLDSGDDQVVFSETGTMSDLGGLSWSPDGTRLAFQPPIEIDIYSLDLATGYVAQLTHGRDNWSPTWSPDGRRIAFVSDRDSNDEIYVMNADGSGQTNLTNTPANDYNPSWSPDGSLIAYLRRGARGVGDAQLIITRADGTCSMQLPSVTGFGYVAWSPDGSQMALEFAGYTGIYLMDIAAALGEDFLTTGPVCP